MVSLGHIVHSMREINILEIANYLIDKLTNDSLGNFSCGNILLGLITGGI